MEKKCANYASKYGNYQENGSKFLGYHAKINRVSFRQDCDALYSDQLHAEPAHSATAAWRTTRPFYSMQSSVVELLRFVEQTTSSVAQWHYGTLSAPHSSALQNLLQRSIQNGSASNTRYLFESRTHGLRNPTTHHQFSSLFLRLWRWNGMLSENRCKSCL